jgi:hypothetical protein
MSWFGFLKTALKLTVPVFIFTCPVLVSILPFSGYVLPFAKIKSISEKLDSFCFKVTPSAFCK